MAKRTKRPTRGFLDLTQAERVARNECYACGKPRKQWIGVYVNYKLHWKPPTVRIFFYKDWGVYYCSNECNKTKLKSITWDKFRQQIFLRDNFTCAVCKQCFKTNKYWHNLVADHIEPLAMGGAMWDENNLQTLCKPCNKLKTHKDMELIRSMKNGRKNKS